MKIKNYLWALCILMFLGNSAWLQAAGNGPVVQDNKGKVAVLPFKVITNDQGVMLDELGREIQEAVVGELMDKARRYQIQDASETLAILARNNLLHDEERLTITPQELAELLGVEYVISGTYNLINKGTHTYGSGVTTYKEKGKETDDKRKGSAINTENSSTKVSYDSKLTLKITNDQGQTLYNETKKPFSSGIENYNGLIERLVKKSPLIN